MSKPTYQKLEYKYNKAASDLIRERDRIFPLDAKVRCRISGWYGFVIGNSSYPDQVRTSFGHSSPRNLELIEEKHHE